MIPRRRVDGLRPVEIGLKNEGDRATGPTLLNVLAPRYLASFRWCGPGGEELLDATPPAETGEEVTDAEGRAWPAQYLSKEIPRVSRRSHYVTFVNLPVEVPYEGAASVSLRANAQADELPDDVEEERAWSMIRVARTRT